MNGGELKQIICFAGFELDPAHRRLTREGQTVTLNAKAFDLLVFLTENVGRVVTKDEILDAVWDGQFVEEANLTVQISALRKALGENINAPRLLATIPGKGYEFIAEIENLNSEIVIEKHKISRVVVEHGETPSVEKRLSAGKSLSLAKLSVSGVLTAFLLGAVFFAWQSSRVKKVFSDTSNIQISKLTTSGRIAVAALSPNGKFIVFAEKDKDGESIWLRQLQTGSQTRIFAPQPAQFVGLTVSPDNDFVYATVFWGGKADTELLRVPLLGGAAQTIPGIVTGNPISFAPGGKQFAFTASKSPGTFLKIADANGANQRILMSVSDGQRQIPTFDTNPIGWSPDGTEIACVIEEKTANGERAGILLVNSEDGAERYLIEPRWAFIGEITWLDNENLALVVYEADEYKNHIYLASRRSGEVRRLTNDTNGYAWLSASGGNLLAVQKTSNSSLLISGDSGFEISDPGLKSATKANPQLQIPNPKSNDLREIFSESYGFADVVWAPDGSILFSSAATGKREIWRINADGSNPLPLTTDAEIDNGLGISTVDGALVFGRSRSGEHSIWTADPNGKNLRQITSGSEDLWANFAPDGKTVYFQRGFDNDLKTIWRVPAGGGEPVQLTKTTSTHPEVSPDGKQIAYFIMDSVANHWRINLISLDTGEVLRELVFPDYVTERRMVWHPSGKFLTLGYSIGDEAKLLLLPVEGGAVRPLIDVGKGETGSFAWSPDGQKIVVARQTEMRDVILINDTE